jgi:hypothetical protein
MSGMVFGVVISLVLASMIGGLLYCPAHTGQVSTRQVKCKKHRRNHPLKKRSTSPIKKRIRFVILKNNDILAVRDSNSDRDDDGNDPSD